jgi:hypothetical protein
MRPDRESRVAQSQQIEKVGDMTLAETFDQLDWTIIESYVELKQEEHLHLDFKTLKNAELTSGEDRRNIARCISGLANSSGGIIIWGIERSRSHQTVTEIPL